MVQRGAWSRGAAHLEESYPGDSRSIRPGPNRITPSFGNIRESDATGRRTSPYSKQKVMTPARLLALNVSSNENRSVGPQRLHRYRHLRIERQMSDGEWDPYSHGAYCGGPRPRSQRCRQRLRSLRIVITSPCALVCSGLVQCRKDVFRRRSGDGGRSCARCISPVGKSSNRRFIKN